MTLVEWVDALLAGQPLDDVHCIDCKPSFVTAASRVASAVATTRDAWSDGIAVDARLVEVDRWRTRLDRTDCTTSSSRTSGCSARTSRTSTRMHGRMQLITGINTALLPGLGGAGRRGGKEEVGSDWLLLFLAAGLLLSAIGYVAGSADNYLVRLYAQLVDDGTRARRHSRRGAIDHGTLVPPARASTVRQLIGDRPRRKVFQVVEPAHVTEPDCAVRHPPADGALARVHRRGWSSSCCCCSSGPDRAVGTAATGSGGPRRRSGFARTRPFRIHDEGHGRRSSNASLRRRGTEDAVDQSVLVVSGRHARPPGVR